MKSKNNSQSRIVNQNNSGTGVSRVIASPAGAKQSPNRDLETPALALPQVQVLLRRHKPPPRNDNSVAVLTGLSHDEFLCN